MLRKFARISLWMVPILFVGLTVASQYGAAQMSDDKTSAQQTVTGCLQKGLEPGGFFLIGANNQHWELYQNDKVSLADHVGQTVAVSGILPKRSVAQEEKSQPYEKKETGSRKHGDFEVSSLKVVSQTCSK
ncbi:MAG: hypothetical protein ABSD63_12605 [Candidatus Korobacteraceae bacterium]